MGVITDLPMPLLGETMEEGRIVGWLLEPGTAYRRGDTLLEVETDKTVVEVPALSDGVLVEILADTDDVVEVGAAIARIETEQAGAATRADQANPAPSEAVPSPENNAVQAKAGTPAKAGTKEQERLRASPAARRLARHHRIDLAGMTGSGRRGRICSDNVRRKLVKVQEVPDRGGKVAGHRSSVHGDLAVTHWQAAGREKGRAVLLHGLFGDGGNWSRLGRQLAGEGWSVHAPDLPGHGETTAEVTGHGQMAGLVASFIREKLNGPVCLVGHSLGAIVAAELAEQEPGLVERLVLLAPAGIGLRINQDFIDGMLQARTMAALARTLEELGGNTPVSVILKHRMLAQLERRRSQLATICAQMAAGGIQQRDIIPLLAALKCPVTTMFVRDDRIIPWQQAGEVPVNVNVRFLAAGGHMPQWSAPALVASLLARGE